MSNPENSEDELAPPIAVVEAELTPSEDNFYPDTFEAEINSESPQRIAQKWVESFIESLLSEEPSVFRFCANSNPFKIKEQIPPTPLLSSCVSTIKLALFENNNSFIFSLKKALKRAIKTYRDEDRFRMNFYALLGELDDAEVDCLDIRTFAEELAEAYGEAILIALNKDTRH